MIPRRLHIIWIGDAARTPHGHIQSWKDRHPDWQVTIWDNERFLQRNWRCAAQMKALGPLDVRAIVELMRLEILYDEGGVAVDADSFCIHAIPEDLLANDAFSCWVDENAQPGVLSTSFVGATSKNPTVGLLLHQIAIEAVAAQRPIDASVGNLRFSQIWRARDFADIKIYPSHYFLSAERAAVGDSVDKTIVGLHERASTRSLADQRFQRNLPLPVGSSVAPAAGQAPVPPPSAVGEKLRVIVFSKDRPLQLHATLASLRARCTDAELLDVQVLALASDEAMQQRYRWVARELPFAAFVAECSFQHNLCEMVQGAGHVAFVCDDALFVRPWSVKRALRTLREIPNAIGVSLRLGSNTTSCYSLQRPQRVPASADLGAGWCACDWTKAELDFAYPLELSSSIYRAQDVWPLLTSLTYRTPNELEEQLAARAVEFSTRLPILVYPRLSIAFCAPLNVVQSTHANRHGGQSTQSAQALALRFDKGERVFIDALLGYTPPACHEEIELPLRAEAAEDAPAVTVIIPCFHQAEFLPMAVASVAVQTFTSWEIVVVNDGSPDDTSAVVSALAARLPGRRIRLIEQANSGLANARNAGARAARGRYLLPLDADDALDPGFLAKTVEILDTEPAVAVVHTDVAIFGARAGVWSTARPFDTAHLLQENGLAYASLYRRQVWEKCGGYQANMTAGYEDWDFWLGAAAAGFRARHIAEPLMLYREKGVQSMLADARRHDCALRARLMLNHLELFSAEQLAAARQTLAANPLPPAKPATQAREVEPGAVTKSSATPAAQTELRHTLPATPADPAASVDALRAAGLWRAGSALRLHLGCGERRIDGYVNVDLPPTPGCLMRSQADIFGDVAQLSFPLDSVDEVRSHHMFEHFPRVEALALLIRWREWLRPGGRLIVETPDIEGSARTLVSNQPLAVKMGVIRHLAGDQAEAWAFHVDHWFPERFRHTLERLGFSGVQVERQSWPQPPYLSNLTVLAVKSEALSRGDLLARADELLAQSLVDPSEQPVLECWRQQLRAVLSGDSGIRRAAAERAALPAAPTTAATEPRAPDALDPASWIAARGNRAPLVDIVDFNQRHRDRWVAQLAATVPAGARVLDVGAGTCPYRARFAHCHYQTHDFKRYEGEKLGGGTTYGHIDFVSDVTAIPAPDASFDVILCTEVLEHVPQPIDAVREMVRLLKPGGRLLLSAPLGSGRHQLPFHYYGGFTPEWYQDVARRLDLEVVSISPNGGFFRLMAQEAARAASLLAQSGGERPPREVLSLLGEHLPRWFSVLDDTHFHDQFTVGYFVETRKALALADSRSATGLSGGLGARMPASDLPASGPGLTRLAPQELTTIDR